MPPRPAGNMTPLYLDDARRGTSLHPPWTKTRRICDDVGMEIENRRPGERVLVPDVEFLRLFMPYEVRLAQRRVATAGPTGQHSLGLYLARLQPRSGQWFPRSREGGGAIGDEIQRLLVEAIRDCDIPVRLSDQEHLALLREIDTDHAYLAAQRFLGAAGRSPLLNGSGMRVRVGYVVYPLSPQANLAPQRWTTLLELARRACERHDDATATASGSGLMRGPAADEASIPETDLIPLAFQDPESLVAAGVLRIQRIHVL